METRSPEGPPPTERHQLEFVTPARSAAERRQRVIVLAVSILVIAVASAGAILRTPDRADAMVFAYNLQPGETRSYDVVLGMHMRPEGVEGADAFSGSMRSTMAMTVKEVRDDGSSVVDLTMTVVSSDLPVDDVPVTGGTMTVTLSPTGEVIDVQGSAGMFAFPGGGLPGADQASGTDTGSSQLFFAHFPDEAIAPGDTWTEESEVPMPIGEGETMTIAVNGEHQGFDETTFGRAARIRQSVDIPMDFEFPFGELFSSIFEGFAEGMSGFGQGPTPTVPPGLDAAKMIFSGGMQMEATSQVIPATGELVDLHGEIEMDIAVETTGFPPSMVQHGLGSFGFGGSMTISVVRTA